MATECKKILFLCSGNYYRSRFAEMAFNCWAQAEGLAWRADSRALSLHLGNNNVGPVAPKMLTILAEMGVAVDSKHRMPQQASPDDFLNADIVVAVKEAEHRPMIEERFKDHAHRVTYWTIHDVDAAPPSEALPLLARQIRALIDELKLRKSV